MNASPVRRLVFSMLGFLIGFLFPYGVRLLKSEIVYEYVFNGLSIFFFVIMSNAIGSHWVRRSFSGRPVREGD